MNIVLSIQPEDGESYRFHGFCGPNGGAVYFEKSGLGSHHKLRPEDIHKMESELAARSIPVSKLCEVASINQSTWGRWKSGTVSPTFRAWDSVIAAYSDILKAHDAHQEVVE